MSPWFYAALALAIIALIASLVLAHRALSDDEWAGGKPNE